MADDLIFKTLEERLGGTLTGALETLHFAAMHGFQSGGIPVLMNAWPVQTGQDIAALVRLRDGLERFVLPALEAAIAGRPGPFDERVGGLGAEPHRREPELEVVETAAVVT